MFVKFSTNARHIVKMEAGGQEIAQDASEIIDVAQDSLKTDKNLALAQSPSSSSCLEAPVSSEVPNGVSGGKLVQVNSGQSGASIFMGTFYKSAKGKECVPQKVLLTPVKGKDGSVTRLLLPRRSSSPPAASLTPTSSASTLSVVIPQVPGKQICKSYVVSPVTTNNKGGTSILNRTPVNLECISIRNTPPLKTYTPNIIRHKQLDKCAQSSVLKQFCHASNPANPSSQTQSPAPSTMSDKTVLTPSSTVSVPSTVKLATLPKLLPAAKIGSSSLLISNSTISKIALASLPPPKPSSTLPVTQSATFTLITPPTSSTSSFFNVSNGGKSNNSDTVISSSSKDSEDDKSEKEYTPMISILKKGENELSSDCKNSCGTTSKSIRRNSCGSDGSDEIVGEDKASVACGRQFSYAREDIVMDNKPISVSKELESVQGNKKAPYIHPEIVTIDDDSDDELDVSAPPPQSNIPTASATPLPVASSPPPVALPPPSVVLPPPSVVLPPPPVVLPSQPVASSPPPVITEPQSPPPIAPPSEVTTPSLPSPPSSPPPPTKAEQVFSRKPSIISNGHIDPSNRRPFVKNKNISNSIAKVLTPSTAVDRAQKRKGQLIVSTPAKKPSSNQSTDSFKMLPGAEDFDPCKVIEWESSGIGKLPSSDIRFYLNNYGMLEVLDNKNTGFHKQSYSELQVSDFALIKKDRDSDEIFCCISCGCYGLLTEFYNENYCSHTCRDELIARQEALFRKRELEIEKENLAKKRKKFLLGLKKLEDSSAINWDDEPCPKKKKCGSDSSKEGDYQQDVMDVDEDSSDVPVVNKPTKPEKIVEPPKPKPVKKKLKAVKAAADTSSEPVNQKGKLRPRDIEKVVYADSDTEEKEDEPSNEKAPTFQRDQEFPWGVYLAVTQCKPAWVKLFQNPFPTVGNSFKKGHKLEAIDPEHQSYFCVVSVAETTGYRINLHFDGYSDKFNFWVNVDSPNIFPCGFASKHGIQLQPPLGIPPSSFSWSNYNSTCKSRNAPGHCFPNHRSSNTAPNLFAVGMKLEAVDKRNSFLVCVATVAAVMDDRILVHFDSWGDMYDYWADTSSPYIHPVGWCADNNHHLTPPLGFKSSSFSWDKYLKETGSVAAPTRAFRLRPHIEFKKGTKIEAIDKRAPHLLRVATIKEVLPYQIKVCFDGFPDHFGYWVDDDCPDIHPIGWGSRTGHPLEPPPKDDLNSPCPTPGCIGQGHVNAQVHETHSDVKDCPYSLDNLRNDHVLEDRFSNKPSENDKDARSNQEVDVDKEDSDSDAEENLSQIRWKWLEMRQMLSKQVKSETLIKTRVLLDSSLTKPLSDIAKHVDDSSNPLSWGPNEVTEFVNRICINKTGIFLHQDIDGQALLMLQKKDLVDVLSLKLGDAIKLYHSILLLRQKVT